MNLYQKCLGVINVMVYNVYDNLAVQTKMMTIFVRKADCSGYIVV